MPYVATDHPRESAVPLAAPSERPARRPRPGWPAIGVGLTTLAVVGPGVGAQLGRPGRDPVVVGLISTALSGVAGIAGLAAAARLRIRSPSAFGVRRTTARWLLIGVGAGVVTFVLKVLAIAAWIRITGDSTDVQGVYGEGGSGGVLSLVLATVFISLLTPVGEELLFQGVVANALLRYGPFIGVVGSTPIFALAHGINTAFPAALVTGLVVGELFRRSGSVWPGVVVHAVVNLPTVPLLVLAGMA